MEDWQEWQIRADQVAAGLGAEVDTLERTYFGGEEDVDFRSFWRKFRDLKERVRTAPAIKLEAKLDLERRLRGIGSKAYKGQEQAFARSSERKNELLGKVGELRGIAERESVPRALRALRRDVERMREEFDAGVSLVPQDRQAVWDAWREANQFAWQRLVDIWNENESYLREFLVTARQQLEKGNGGGARQQVGRFFDSLKTHEAKQEAVTTLKADADGIRRDAEQIEDRTVARAVVERVQTTPILETWKSDLARNRELGARLSEEVAALERQLQASESILEQAMVRGTIVDKRRKLTELERSSRSLEQRIEQTEESPLMPTAG
jgi:hypothetical protein